MRIEESYLSPETALVESLLCLSYVEMLIASLPFLFLATQALSYVCLKIQLRVLFF
jgi:hypothetical protein